MIYYNNKNTCVTRSPHPFRFNFSSGGLRQACFKMSVPDVIYDSAVRTAIKPAMELRDYITSRPPRKLLSRQFSSR